LLNYFRKCCVSYKFMGVPFQSYLAYKRITPKDDKQR